jgi:hypothetical protein
MPTHLPTLRECKVRASLLLKALRSGDPVRARVAAERFRTLRPFAGLDAERIVAWRDQIRRKHALAVIAGELGFDSWLALRGAAGESGSFDTPNMEWMWANAAVYLNHWCATYEDAAAIRRETNGFLFPYRSQFVVCTAEFLDARGIDPHDADWDLIGRDWAKPRDAAAFRRLASRLIDAGLAA